LKALILTLSAPPRGTNSREEVQTEGEKEKALWPGDAGKSGKGGWPSYSNAVEELKKRRFSTDVDTLSNLKYGVWEAEHNGRAGPRVSGKENKWKLIAEVWTPSRESGEKTQTTRLELESIVSAGRKGHWQDPRRTTSLSKTGQFDRGGYLQEKHFGDGECTDLFTLTANQDTSTGNLRWQKTQWEKEGLT